MKCMLLSYFLALLVIWNISNVQMVKLKSEKHQTDEIKKLIDCKICQEMFQYEFNYEKLLKDDSKINLLKSFFEEISESNFNLNDYFSKDNLEFVSKEISMQYFFKGEDSLFSSEENMEKFKNCKSLKTTELNINNNNNSNNNQCDLMKFKICENVLSVDENACVDFHKKIKLLRSKKAKKDNSAFSSDDDSNEHLNLQKLSELENKVNQQKQKVKASVKVAGVNIYNLKEKKEQGKIVDFNMDKEYKSDELNAAAIIDKKLKSSFIANKENGIDDFENYESLKRKFNNIHENLNSNKNEDSHKNYNNAISTSYSPIEENIKKLMDMKAKNEQEENSNFKSKQNNKFISLDFNSNKQDSMTQENDAFAEKDLNKFSMQNKNLRKSKFII